jgi:pseudouridine-5'-phosphate glycosidase
MDSAEEIARAHQMRGLLDLPGGQLVANPIPVEAEIAASELAPVIEAALSDAEAQGITAKEVTPFLLDRMYQMTEGRSLTANIALVLNNARLAAKIAAALHELTHK